MCTRRIIVKVYSGSWNSQFASKMLHISWYWPLWQYLTALVVVQQLIDVHAL